MVVKSMEPHDKKSEEPLKVATKLWSSRKLRKSFPIYVIYSNTKVKEKC